MLEFDLLSDTIKNEINNKVEGNFARSTADNIRRVLHVLASTSNFNSNGVQIAQLEIGIQLNLSQNRVSELLKLAKKAGLIGIDMICRCGDIRNEYTLLDNPIINTIKRIVFNTSKSDPKADIEIAIHNTMLFYKVEGVPEHVLQEAKSRIPIDKFKRATGIPKYFKRILGTIKRELLEETEPGTTYTTKNKKSCFNDYPQRKYDFDKLEEKILGTNPNNDEEFNFQDILKKSRE
ncbi:hypothetical protein LGL08_20190 [Clostridium estertheticum]|uniref:hypothetical protein n=1 Tax=Clostridium estertheticum TaxID=238834 RepID=UPI001CF2BAAD|nr:hypothetical protein [Clostridium estertheticum]MCB2309026.1 hypothetical protein [Clostridium estertheticum]MCB2346840.1 hypothetical protein [Clostridium estertheticum]MCB2351848.1 hypothetical protein [Clostridium estertheticum]WAG48451.1 hypothetical protein LL127_22995 [Clostridium estertheticum]